VAAPGNDPSFFLWKKKKKSSAGKRDEKPSILNTGQKREQRVFFRSRGAWMLFVFFCTEQL
jgi:hypothetical protein